MEFYTYKFEVAFNDVISFKFPAFFGKWHYNKRGLLIIYLFYYLNP